MPNSTIIFHLFQNSSRHSTTGVWRPAHILSHFKITNFHLVAPIVTAQMPPEAVHRRLLVSGKRWGPSRKGNLPIREYQNLVYPLE